MSVHLYLWFQVRNNPKRSCQFNRTMLGDCSGMSDRFYGYSRGQPCILIKLNRVGNLWDQVQLVLGGARGLQRNSSLIGDLCPVCVCR